MTQVIFRFAAVALMSFLSSQSFAGIIINPVSSSTFPVGFNGGTLDVASSTSTLEFTEILNQQTATNGTLSVSGITAVGAASSTPVGGIQFISQPTLGGDFSLNDDATGGLLLSGTFGSGAIVGSDSPTTNAAGFGTDNVIFNGGSLLQFIDTDGSFNLSFILDPPLQIGGTSGQVSPFDGNFTGQIDVQASGGQVPEPSSALMFSPILLMGLISRRRARKV